MESGREGRTQETERERKIWRLSAEQRQRMRRKQTDEIQKAEKETEIDREREGCVQDVVGLST